MDFNSVASSLLLTVRSTRCRVCKNLIRLNKIKSMHLQNSWDCTIYLQGAFLIVQGGIGKNKETRIIVFMYAVNIDPSHYDFLTLRKPCSKIKVSIRISHISKLV